MYYKSRTLKFTVALVLQTGDIKKSQKNGFSRCTRHVLHDLLLTQEMLHITMALKNHIK